MTLADNLKPVVYNLRSIAGKLGFRPFSVSIEIRTPINDLNAWESVTQYTSEIIPITSKDGYNPKVRWLNEKDYAIGYPTDAEMEIGPITPEFFKDGYYGLSYDTLNAVNERTGVEVYYIINGPGFVNAKFQKVSFNAEKTLGYTIQIKRIANG